MDNKNKKNEELEKNSIESPNDNMIKCPKCNSDNITFSLVKRDKFTVGCLSCILFLIGGVCLFGPFGLFFPIIALIILAAAPQTENIGTCQNCGCSFNSETKKILKNFKRK